MPHIPFLSRLHVREYFALVISLLLVTLESLIALITLALPAPIIKLCYRLTRRLFNWFSSPQGRRSRQKNKAVVSSITAASDFVELCELHGYAAEEHIVQTADGYLLGLHRLAWRRGEEDARINVEGGRRKKVVYMHHGLMMNSEVWVCLTESERCLPFALVERGYDVWLGNNRGNKYSKKCVHHAPTETKFWDFSIDQFAFHDIPDAISYILSTTRQPSLSYIGFSQGTAQAFATLSIHPTLNERVDVFIALAPAMSPKNFTATTIVYSFITASPDILFLAFGRRAILGSMPMWQSILYPPIFVRIIDVGVSFLFGWKTNNITPHQKLAAYPRLYSYTSTKSLVHWFQIIRNGVFQMYDDEAPNPVTGNRNKYYKVAKFPTRNIKTPIVLVYGGSDSLVDIEVMRKELPRHTVAREIPHYEHLDFLWASSVHQLVFPHVFDALERIGDDVGTRKSRSRHRSTTSPLLGPDDPDEESSTSPAALRTRKVSQNTARISWSDSEPPAFSTSAPSFPPFFRLPASPGTSTLGPAAPSSQRLHSSAQPRGFSSGADPAPRPRVASHTPSVEPSQHTAPSSTSRPEGWWSSDEVGGDDDASLFESTRPILDKTPTEINFATMEEAEPTEAAASATALPSDQSAHDATAKHTVFSPPSKRVRMTDPVTSATTTSSDHTERDAPAKHAVFSPFTSKATAHHSENTRPSPANTSFRLEPQTQDLHKSPSPRSMSSQRSVRSGVFGDRGISIGAAQAVSGLTEGVVSAGSGTASPGAGAEAEFGDAGGGGVAQGDVAASSSGKKIFEQRDKGTGNRAQGPRKLEKRTS